LPFIQASVAPASVDIKKIRVSNRGDYDLANGSGKITVVRPQHLHLFRGSEAMLLALNQTCSGHATSRVRVTVQPFADNPQPNFHVEFKTCGEVVKGNQLHQQLRDREISGKKPSAHVHYTYKMIWSYPPIFLRMNNVPARPAGPKVFDVDPAGGFWEIVNLGPATIRVEFQPVNGQAYLDA